MELKELDILKDDVRCCSVQLIPLQLLIGLHNVSQLVRKVILQERKE